LINLPSFARTLDYYWFTSAFRAGKAFPRIDLSRCLEYPLVYERLDLHDGHRVLDVGSGYSIFPLYLAATRRFQVYITDSETHLPNVLAFHRAKLAKLGLSDDLVKGQVVVEHQDARHLTYPDASFERVSCISVIEHLSEDGDGVAACEIGRVLRPGGIAVLTFPYAHQYEERPFSSWVEYFERSYDDSAIEKRLIEPSGLSEVSRAFFGESSLHISRMYHRDIPRPVRLAFELTSPLWMRACMRIWDSPVEAAYGAVLVLAKPEVGT
jgi:SAM-dependent methyltransferase